MIGIFSKFIFNNAIFNTDSGSDTHDGAFDHGHYKRHRKKLERLAQLSDSFNQAKYIKEAVKVAEIAESTPVQTPVIQEIAAAVKNKISIPEIDVSSLQAEIDRLLSYLDKYIAQQQQEDEDELTILMYI